MIDTVALRNWSEITADFQLNWYVYLSMPLIAAFIGYTTKLLAIEMIFRPLNFRGIKLGPIPLGWQGVLPAMAGKIAAIAVDVLVPKVIDPRELADKLDMGRMVTDLREPLNGVVEQMVDDIARHVQPAVWEMMPPEVRRLVSARVLAEAPKYLDRMMADVKRDFEEIVDIKDVVVTALTRDKALLVRLVRKISAPEFRFMANSGIYFGAVIGVVQMLCWAVIHDPIIMPIFGLVCGFVTDWVALNMIFRPHNPTKFLGVFEFQGLFIKRRREIARDYAGLIADEILTPANVLEIVLAGPTSNNLFEMVQRHFAAAIDEQLSIAKPLAVLAVGGLQLRNPLKALDILQVGTEEFQKMKVLVAQKAFDMAPQSIKHVEQYATDVIDVKTTVMAKLDNLTNEEFEDLLRPIIKEQEPIVIACGALLGFAVGELQVLFVEAVSRMP